MVNTFVVTFPRSVITIIESGGKVLNDASDVVLAVFVFVGLVLNFMLKSTITSAAIFYLTYFLAMI